MAHNQIKESSTTDTNILSLLGGNGKDTLQDWRKRLNTPAQYALFEHGDKAQPFIASYSPIANADRHLYNKYHNIIELNTNLTRQIVSFQANKEASSYRLYRYKEAFSYTLVEYFLKKYRCHNNVILDPFCGSGTTVFASSNLDNNAIGIELLPIGYSVCKARQTIISLSNEHIKDILNIVNKREWEHEKAGSINELRITAGAFPEHTLSEISRFLLYLSKLNDKIRDVLFFVLLAISEEVSFTRKDGQYLRWDYRAGRTRTKTHFDKGHIADFYEALLKKMHQIASDHKVSSMKSLHLQKFINGSCLTELQNIEDNVIDMVITSPPYCNRYDYTRTYALELALLGCNENNIVELRQSMLSCTVENKLKDLLFINAHWKNAVKACDSCELLQLILRELDDKKKNKELNNSGIPRMIRGYFYDMACVIYELYRVLNDGGRIIMVNDNVKYAGINISVDLILSSIAESLGFKIENIFVLPQKKGNSSQQMGLHGREALRKCVYVWRKV